MKQSIILILFLLSAFGLSAQTDITPAMLNDSMKAMRKIDYNKSVEIGKEGLLLAEKTGDTAMSALIADNLSGFYILMGKNDSALLYLNQAMYWYQFCGDDVDMLWCRFYLGIIYAQQGLPDTAIYIYQNILQYPDIKGLGNLYPMVLINLGNVYYNKSMYNSASLIYTQSRDHYRSIHDTSGFISSSINLGGTLNTMNHFDSAIVVLLEGLHWAEENQDFMRKVSLQTNLCESWSGLGRYNDALKAIDEVIIAREETNDMIGLSNSYRTKGNILIAKNEYDRANEYFVRSLKIDEELALPVNMAATYCMIGRSLQLKKDFHAAIAYFRQGFEIAEKAQAGQEMKNALINQALSWSALGDLEQAEQCIKLHDNLLDSLQQIDILTFAEHSAAETADAPPEKFSAKKNWSNILLSISLIINILLLFLLLKSKRSRAS